MHTVLDEDFMDQQFEKVAEKYFKKYPEHMKVLEKSPLARVKSISTYDYYALGKMLEQWDVVVKICEASVGSISDLGLLPRVAHDVITINYGTSPMAVIASIQPIDEELGNVYYKTISARTSRGNKSANEAIVNVDTGMQEVPQGYASAKISDEDVGDGDGSSTAVVNTTLANTPVRKGSVTVRATIGGSVVTGTDGHIEQLGLTGTIIGDGILSGTITYATGAIVVEFDTAPDNGTNITTTYQADFEAASDITTIGTELTTKPIRAIPYALKEL